MIEIRPANDDDLDWLVGELREFDRFYQTKKRLFGEEAYVREKMLEVIRTHVCIIAENKDPASTQRIGFIAGILRPHFYNPDLQVLSQLLWWVVPGKRQSVAATMLMDTFIEYGRAYADWITFNMSRWTPVKKESFLRRGFEISDQVYLMELP